MPPGSFARTVEGVGAKIRHEEETEEEKRERGAKGGWCPSLTCHEDGRHVMTVNAEQIGSGGKEERLGGGGGVEAGGDRWQSWPSANHTET